MSHSTIFHETKTHGKVTFPYIVYRGNIPEYIRSYPLHWHDEIEIIFIKSGTGIITVQSEHFIVHANDIIIIMPHTVHSIEQYHNAEMEYFNILFRFSLLTSSAGNTCYMKYFKPMSDHLLTVSPYLSAPCALNRTLRPYVIYLIENRKKSYTKDELMVKSNLFAIMHHLNQFSVKVSSSELSRQNTYDKLKNALLLVQSDYNHDIPVSEAASVCGFSASHFMKLFREFTGKSFSQYLKKYRLEMAACQLTESSQKIIDIAENTGFHNLSYFTRAFVEMYGLTPSAYRAKRDLSN